LEKQKLFQIDFATNQEHSRIIDTLPEYTYGERIVFLSDTTILVTGGRAYGAAIPNTFEIDVTSYECATKQAMLSPREGHGMIKFYNVVYVFGGRVEVLSEGIKSAEMYNISSDTWTN